MLAQTELKNCIGKPVFTRCRIGIASGLVLVACSLNVWAQTAVDQYLQVRLMQTDEVGNVVIQTRKGDSLRVISQHYSRVNNIPFARALEILQTTNASQFPNNDADQMLIGTRLVLPAKNQNVELIAAVTSPPSDGSMSTATISETTTNTASVALPSALPPANDDTIASLKQKARSLRAQLNRFEDKLQAQVQGTAVAPYYAKLKSWFLAVPASLWVIIIPTIFLIWVVARLTRQRSADLEISSESKYNEVQPSHSITEPTQEPTVDVSISEPAPTVETSVTRVPDQVIDGWMASARADSDTTTAISTTTNNKQIEAISEHSEAQTTSVTPQDVDVSVHDSQISSESATNLPHSVEANAEPLTQTETTTDSSFDKLKQVLNGLTADQLDLRSTKTDHHTNLSNESHIKITADVNSLLQQYAQRATIKPVEHTIHYGIFRERARLQKWMHALTPEQLLSHAQSAHQQGQNEVAQYILNEVLMRGNAAQCTQALDLRNVWLNQAHNASDHEAK